MSTNPEITSGAQLQALLDNPKLTVVACELLLFLLLSPFLHHWAPGN